MQAVGATTSDNPAMGLLGPASSTNFDLNTDGTSNVMLSTGSGAVTVDTIAYDAGTEADTEAAIDIPGPAGGGEGFNPGRSDAADRVAMHAGIVSQDDGFATSDLSEQHRFDNPVMRVHIERTQ